MNDIIITIDPRSNRIRMFKTFLTHLDDPAYVTLLIDTKNKVLAITDKKLGNKTAIKLNIARKNKHSAEIYSKSLIKAIFSLLELEDTTSSYHFEGYMDNEKRTAFFPLSKATKLTVKESK